MRDDYAEHWREWVGYDFGAEPTEFTASTDWEGYTFDSFGGEPLGQEFADWYAEYEELIEDDFEGVGFTHKLLIKDWLSQAWEAARG
jgi:hypothetical protein